MNSSEKNGRRQPTQRFLHPREIAAPTKTLHEGGASFLPWLGEHHPRLTGRDIGRLIGTAVYAGRTHAFIELWRLWQTRGAVLDNLAQACPGEDETRRFQPGINPFWRESLAHRVFSRWTSEDFPERKAMWAALRGAGLMRTRDKTKRGGTLLHSLLASSSFQFHSANPSVQLRQDTMDVAQEMVVMGIDRNEPDTEGVSAYVLACRGLPELASAWDADRMAMALDESLPVASLGQDYSRL